MPTSRLYPLCKFLLLGSLISLLTACVTTTNLEHQQNTQKFIAKVSQQYNFEPQYLASLFNQVKPQPKIIASMTKPHEKLPWYLYRKTFVTQARAQEGVKFWLAHAKTLEEVQQRYGVPANIIVAILGVETRYGSNMGKYRVIDTLSTLAFDYPPRAKFFQDELTQFLLMTRENNTDPLSIYGSYAGAMGEPQFMPSSYRHYAVAYTENTHPDLFKNQEDIISSVANYFKKNGWQTNQPIAAPASVSGSQYQLLANQSPKPRYSIAQLIRSGVKIPAELTSQQQAALMRFEGDNTSEYWLGFHNFYVITRYNTSPQYALAVYQLSDQINTLYQQHLQTVAATTKHINNQIAPAHVAINR